VLVVGATGHVGGKIVRGLLKEKSLNRPGLGVAALVREGSDASKLQALGVEILLGDMLDVKSLDGALVGIDGIFMAAASYMSRRRGDCAAHDDVGFRNLLAAAKRANVKRFVLASVINSEKAPDVHQLYVKALAEQWLRKESLPFVSVRTGMFVDQGDEMYEKEVRRNKLTSIGDPKATQFAMTTTQIYADAMVRAMFTPEALNQVIDVGFQESLTTQQLADVISHVTHRQIEVRTVPFWAARLVLGVAAIFNDLFGHVKAMLLFIHKDGGVHFRGDFSTYERVFGEKVPTAEEGIKAWVEEKRLGI